MKLFLHQFHHLSGGVGKIMQEVNASGEVGDVDSGSGRSTFPFIAKRE